MEEGLGFEVRCCEECLGFHVRGRATRSGSGCRVRGGWFKTFPRYQCKGTWVEETGMGRGGKGWGRGGRVGARSGFQWEESLSLIENSTEYIVQGKKGKRRKAKEC